MRVIKTRYLTKTIEVHRSWRKRLWSWPWRPWRAYRCAQVPSDQVYLLDDKTVVMNPDHPNAHKYLDAIRSEYSLAQCAKMLGDIQDAKRKLEEATGGVRPNRGQRCGGSMKLTVGWCPGCVDCQPDNFPG